jgi:hypothetical protein
MFNDKIDAMMTKIKLPKPENIEPEVESEILDPKIIKPISLIMTFESQDEFFDYYNSHKTEMDSLTNHKLNKLFSIDGYRITKIQNVLKLKQINISKDRRSDGFADTQTLRIEIIENRISVLEDALNRIIEYINSTIG